MKKYMLKNDFRDFKKGAQFYLIAESEFIGIKEYVLRSGDLKIRLSINDSEFRKNFILLS
ncbi:hypothetical protein LC048_20390 [Mesobacillus subterraneus]|uniref:hypothetical protein n=1 Tax=Mesobacillus subterraneus TaxID=285983 RepID=UPI001CFE3D5E|nr:hypothetical protein [Mesobacillus subterraneus]WLR54738.1 hypothetical protein LC048_20390 [Mesobacillus subterraneus]